MIHGAYSRSASYHIKFVEDKEVDEDRIVELALDAICDEVVGFELAPSDATLELSCSGANNDSVSSEESTEVSREADPSNGKTWKLPTVDSPGPPQCVAQTGWNSSDDSAEDRSVASNSESVGPPVRAASSFAERLMISRAF